SLIQDVVLEVSPAVEKEHLHITIIPSDTHLPKIQADTNKIKQVLINLLGNAIKFTPPGGKISISTSLHENMVQINISDTGCGLLPEDIPMLFTKFGMLEKNYSSKSGTQSTGLGLYICKSIIELHGGKI